MNKLRELFDDPTVTMTNLIENTSVDISNLPTDVKVGSVCMKDDTFYICTGTSYDTIDCSYHHDIVYIHKTNCPNCGGLLDGDEHNPYVKCTCCGAKVWSEREIS